MSGADVPSFAAMDRDQRKKNMLSGLWIFAMFNYLYADIMTLMNPAILRKMVSGGVEGIQMTPEFLLAAAFLMETAIAMTFLARILPRSINRWANMGAGLLNTAAVLASLTVGGPPPAYYIFFAAIEVTCTLFIIGYAWRWKVATAATNPQVQVQGVSA